MPEFAISHDIYLEIGTRRTFAGAIGWPGWCRSGRDEVSAMQSLVESGPRYARILQGRGLGFEAPEAASAFNVVERLEGNTTTDFGAPDAPPSSDSAPIDEAELHHYESLLEACWAAFDRAVELAAGKELRKGPRGGGRDLEGILDHVLAAEVSYLKRIGRKVVVSGEEGLEVRFDRVREEILAGLAAGARGELPEKGPRGGKRWTPRTFLRRAA